MPFPTGGAGCGALAFPSHLQRWSVTEASLNLRLCSSSERCLTRTFAPLFSASSGRLWSDPGSTFPKRNPHTSLLAVLRNNREVWPHGLQSESAPCWRLRSLRTSQAACPLTEANQSGWLIDQQGGLHTGPGLRALHRIARQRAKCPPTLAIAPEEDGHERGLPLISQNSRGENGGVSTLSPLQNHQ